MESSTADFVQCSSAIDEFLFLERKLGIEMFQIFPVIQVLSRLVNREGTLTLSVW